LRTYALLALTLLATGGQATEQEPVAAVWQERQLRFSYVSLSSIDSCREQEAHIANVLLAVGARSDVEVTIANCDSYFDSPVADASDGAGWPRDPAASEPDHSVHAPSSPFVGWPGGASVFGPTGHPSERHRQAIQVTVRLSVPVEMTPDVMVGLKADRRRRELIARVTGNPLVALDNPIAFPAQRQVVTLSHKTTGIEAADCELIDKMTETIFRKLDVRVVQRDYVCDRTWTSRIAPTLAVEALVPVPVGIASVIAASVSDDDQNAGHED